MRAMVPPIPDENPSNQLGFKNKMRGFNLHTKYLFHVWILNNGRPGYKPAYIEWIMLSHYWNNFRDGCATTTRTVKMGRMNTRIAVSVTYYNFSDVNRFVKKAIEAFTSLIMWAGSQNDRWWVPWAKFAPSGIKRSNSKWVPTRRGESAGIITRHKMSDCRKVKLSFRELITRTRNSKSRT